MKAPRLGPERRNDGSLASFWPIFSAPARADITSARTVLAHRVMEASILGQTWLADSTPVTRASDVAEDSVATLADSAVMAGNSAVPRPVCRVLGTLSLRRARPRRGIAW